MPTPTSPPTTPTSSAAQTLPPAAPDESLSRLDLTRRSLTAVPVGLLAVQITQELRHLDLSFNDLESFVLPRDAAPQLATLRLEGNLLSTFPHGLPSTLRALSLHDNHIETIDDGALADLPLLEGLSLYNNELAALPESISHLSALVDLFLDGNALSELPDNMFEGLELLQRVDLSRNGLTALPASIGGCRELVQLHAQENALVELPDSICNLSSLRHLFVQENSLRSLPEDIGALGELRQLVATSNKLSALPDLTGLCELQRLYLGKNAFTEFPSTIAVLPAVKWIYLSENEIAALPDSIQDLVSVSELYLNDNTLSFLPASIGRLAECLDTLHLAGNRLATIPETLGDLTALERLYLARNPLSELPSSLARLERLRILDLDEMPYLHTPPRSVIRRGTPMVLSFLDKLERTNASVFYRASLVVVGPPGSGKSLLLSQLRDRSGWNRFLSLASKPLSLSPVGSLRSTGSGSGRSTPGGSRSRVSSRSSNVGSSVYRFFFSGGSNPPTPSPAPETPLPADAGKPDDGGDANDDGDDVTVTADADAAKQGDSPVPVLKLPPTLQRKRSKSMHEISTAPDGESDRDPAPMSPPLMSPKDDTEAASAELDRRLSGASAAKADAPEFGSLSLANHRMPIPKDLLPGDGAKHLTLQCIETGAPEAIAALGPVLRDANLLVAVVFAVDPEDGTEPEAYVRRMLCLAHATCPDGRAILVGTHAGVLAPKDAEAARLALMEKYVLHERAGSLTVHGVEFVDLRAEYRVKETRRLVAREVLRMDSVGERLPMYYHEVEKYVRHVMTLRTGATAQPPVMRRSELLEDMCSANESVPHALHDSEQDKLFAALQSWGAIMQAPLGDTVVLDPAWLLETVVVPALTPARAIAQSPILDRESLEKIDGWDKDTGALADLAVAFGLAIRVPEDRLLFPHSLRPVSQAEAMGELALRNGVRSHGARIWRMSLARAPPEGFFAFLVSHLVASLGWSVDAGTSRRHSVFAAHRSTQILVELVSKDNELCPHRYDRRKLVECDCEPTELHVFAIGQHSPIPWDAIERESARFLQGWFRGVWGGQQSES